VIDATVQRDRDPLLVVRDFSVAFPTHHGRFVAVEGIGFSIARGEIVGIVGESGCGKSLTALALLGLLPEPGFRAGGQIRFEGRAVEQLSERQLQTIRGNRIAMIFQEPMTSLNPTQRIGRQIMEPMRLHQGLDRTTARARAIAALESVGIPAPQRRMHEYANQLSGGMRQRVMIAMAIGCDPALLVADEPTTALDVTIQAQILDLLRNLVAKRGMAVLFITHDLGVVAEICHRVLVMYAGRIVESATVADLFEGPLHPYTRGLTASIPRIDQRVEMLTNIPGVVPGVGEFVDDCCRFAPRCDRRMAVCDRKTPRMRAHRPGHQVACHLYPTDDGP
jgi:peptide/nickel transport system ATP-binding protein